MSPNHHFRDFVSKLYKKQAGCYGALIGLARKYKVTDMTIHHIVVGNTWKESRYVSK